jgi:hypothetical protein
VEKQLKRRYRSNRFAPKVKRPFSFELTKYGRRRLLDVMDAGEISLGDLVEFFLRRYGDEVSIAAVDATVRSAQRVTAA